MMKRFIAVILSLALLCSLVPAAFAASDAAQKDAQALYDLGLFQGTGNNADGTPNFDLDRTPTRAEAVTMLVRLLGKDAEATAGSWTTPFTDVADWAKPYVGYAYTNGLTTGTSATTFGGEAPINVTQYLTFVLRALGYTSGTDFQWDSAWTKADEIGLTNGYTYNASTTTFTRGDVANISVGALYTKGKGEDKTLGEKIGKFELLELTPENLKGVWKNYYIGESGYTHNEEVIFDSNTYQRIAKSNSSVDYSEGEFTIADGKVKSPLKNNYYGIEDMPVFDYSKEDFLARLNDGSYVLRSWSDFYKKVEKSELLDEGLKAKEKYKAEHPTLEIILVNTLQDDSKLTDILMTHHEENYDGTINSVWKMSNFHYDSTRHSDNTYTVTIYISGEWLKDRTGGNVSGTNSCDIEWRLYDENHEYVIDSGTIYSPKVYAGGKFKDASDMIFNLPPATYYLELS